MAVVGMRAKELGRTKSSRVFDYKLPVACAG